MKRSVSKKAFRFCLFGLWVFAAVLFGCSNGTKQNLTDEKESAVVISTQKFEAAETSVQMAKNMAIGWNLGNTLDATGKGLSSETSWGQPYTTKAMITGIKNAGFNTIRIPVSWANHTTDDDYTIDPAWMNRVKTIVDWSLEAGLCVILNDHHDNYAESKLKTGYALSRNSEIQDKSKAFLSSVWKQIAITFADYDNRLVFELLNEPRDVDGEVCGNEWWTNDKSLINVITAYEQVCLNQIRSVPGNENRFVMVSGYAASSDTGIISLYTMPNDSATDRLILSVHAYSPYSFAMEDPGEITFTSSHKSQLNSLFSYLNSNYVSEGIGVVIGETGATNKNNLSDRIEWAKAFFGGAYQYGIPSVLWDNGNHQVFGSKYDDHYGYYNRRNQTWYFPSLIEAMMKSVYGDSITINTNDQKGTEATHISTRTVDISNTYSNITIAENHPWVNGKQDTSVISNYQYVLDISNFYENDLPKNGDKLKILWKGKSNIDIAKLRIRPVDTSSNVNYWKELTSNTDNSIACVNNIKAEIEFSLEQEIEITADAIANISLCISYELEDGKGPAIIKSSK